VSSIAVNVGESVGLALLPAGRERAAPEPASAASAIPSPTANLTPHAPTAHTQMGVERPRRCCAGDGGGGARAGKSPLASPQPPPEGLCQCSCARASRCGVPCQPAAYDGPQSSWQDSEVRRIVRVGVHHDQSGPAERGPPGYHLIPDDGR
jgi:hypothetical protein